MDTQDCQSTHKLSHILKYADHTLILGLMNALLAAGGWDGCLWRRKLSCPQQWQDQEANAGFQEDSRSPATSAD